MDLAGQRAILKKAFSFKKIKHVAISINSPGGSPVQSHLIYSYIKQLAKEKKVKVIIFAEDVAASGGYLISCAGDEIYANSSSIIGSIGVISASFGFKDLIKKIGIERRVYTAGKNKSTLDPFVDEKEEDVKRLKSIQLELHADFIKVVKTSRGSKLKEPEKNNIFTVHIKTIKMSKIKKEELEVLHKQENAKVEIRNRIGLLQIEIHSLSHAHLGVQEEQNKTKEELEEKYGKINIDLKDGSYEEIKEE